MPALAPHTTLLEAVRKSLELAARATPGDTLAPAALLWCDPDQEWTALVAMLFPNLPELYILGAYNPEKRTGPAIWLRCVIEGALEDSILPANKTPILYLPGVSRQALRAGEACPDALKPLVELQYRGAVWAQRNGRDWTPEAFMMADDGLGLDLARDRQTRQAMLGALPQLAITPIARLLGKKLEAEDFDRLMVTDTPRDLLAWLDQPARIRESWDASRWSAFCSRCRSDYGFDPEKDGELQAAEKLGLQAEDNWRGVWQRVKEAPGLYRNLYDQLRRAKPAGQLLFDKEPWPDENDKEEEALRQALITFADLGDEQARQRIAALEEQHGLRRSWIWASLGAANLALALQHLVLLACETSTAPGGAAPEEMAAHYRERGQFADRAVWQSLTCVSTNRDKNAVTAAIRAIYLPWLEQSALHFQKLLQSQPLSAAAAVGKTEKTCWLFVDGLRFDVAQRLDEMLTASGLESLLSSRWAALPTVTATSKPAVTPLAAALSGQNINENFEPSVRSTGHHLNSDRFRKMLTEEGFQLLDNNETGQPATGSSAWTEWGQFDRLGHNLEAAMANQIDEQLALLAGRIRELLAAGWPHIRLITDHGWLLVPGGLPKVDLPKYLVASRWSRCAAVKESAHVALPTAAWHWNSSERFAHAPGIHCFERGHEYAHGGISLQECLIPEMSIKAMRRSAPITITIKGIQWAGMRCRVQIDPAEGVVADLRTRPNDPSSTITSAKEFDEQGSAALLVSDDSLEGTVASLVISDNAGVILAKQMTLVGGKE